MCNLLTYADWSTGINLTLTQSQTTDITFIDISQEPSQQIDFNQQNVIFYPFN